MDKTVRLLEGKKAVPTKLRHLSDRLSRFEKVSIDIGCGDGKFLYRLALKFPDQGFIGLDPNCASMSKISYKISRKPCKGGVSNTFYMCESLENWPIELANLVDSVYINFPWAGLLSGIIKVDKLLVEKISIMAKDGASIKVVLSYDLEIDRIMVNKFHLPQLKMRRMLKMGKKFERYNIVFKKIILKPIKSLQINSSWGKRLATNPHRDVYILEGIVEK